MNNFALFKWSLDLWLFFIYSIWQNDWVNNFIIWILHQIDTNAFRIDCQNDYWKTIYRGFICLHCSSFNIEWLQPLEVKGTKAFNLTILTHLFPSDKTLKCLIQFKSKLFIFIHLSFYLFIYMNYIHCLIKNTYYYKDLSNRILTT